MDIIASHGFTLLALACVFGLFMAWGIGANDVANAMGTSVGSRALTLKQAIVVAAIFEFAGAYLAGGEVTSTIRKGIIDPTMLADSPDLLVFRDVIGIVGGGNVALYRQYPRLAGVDYPLYRWRYCRLCGSRYLGRRGCLGKGRYDCGELDRVSIARRFDVICLIYFGEKPNLRS
jgi:hypothetical protein